MYKRQRQERQDDDGQDDQRKILFDERQVAEEVAAVQKRGGPEHAAGHIVTLKPAVAHAAGARHERREGAHDRHEAGDDDGFTAVPFEELVGAIQIGLLENPGIGAKHLFPQVAADRIIDRIAGDGGKRH